MKKFDMYKDNKKEKTEKILEDSKLTDKDNENNLPLHMLIDKNDTSHQNRNLNDRDYINDDNGDDRNRENKLFQNDYSRRVNKQLNSLKSQDEHDINISQDSSKEDDILNDSDISVLSELNEIEQKELFDRLRTKKGFYTKKGDDKKILKTKENLETEDKLKPKNMEDVDNQSKLFKTNIDHIKNKKQEEHEKSHERSKSKSDNEYEEEKESYVKKIEKLSSLELNFPIVQLIKKNTQKMKLIQNKGKKKMNSYDFFYYDKSKWPSSLNSAQKLNIKIKQFEDRRGSILQQQILANFDADYYERQKLEKLEEKRKYFEKQTAVKVDSRKHTPKNALIGSSNKSK